MEKKMKTYKKLYKISLQYLENYNCDSFEICDSHYKFKFGKDVVVEVPMTEAIWEENAYGEGQHKYYEYPQESEATIVQKINYLENNGELGGLCVYIPRDWEYISQEQLDSYEDWEKPTVYTIEEINLKLSEIEVAA